MVIGAVFLLYRFAGMAALDKTKVRAEQGPTIGEVAKAFVVPNVRGDGVGLGSSARSAQLVVFSSLNCPVCTETWNSLSLLAQGGSSSQQLIIVSAGASDEIKKWAARFPDGIDVVPDPEFRITQAWRVATTPFAVLLDEYGRAVSKGAPRTIEQFQELFAQTQGDNSPAELSTSISA